MEFFVFVDDEKPLLQGFSISFADAEMEISEVIEKFVSKVKETNPNFDSSKYKVYLYNYSNPTEQNDPELIPDLSASINSLKTQNFDLILSTTQPAGDLFNDFESDAEVEEESEYDQLISQGKMYYELKDYQRAFQLFQLAGNHNKDAIVPIQYQIRIYIKAKRYRTAIQMAQNGISKFPADRKLLSLYAKAQQLSGNHNDAICYFKRMLMLPPHTQSAIDDVNCHIARSLIEMGSLDQAMSLLQPIATNNPTNLKVILLMAKTLYLQGRIHDALHIVLQSFSIDPYHKESREFIGNCITTENQAEVLRSQLGDGINDSKVLFIMGHILHEHGSCEIARPFLKDALDLDPNEPSIAVTYLLNTLCISNSCIQTMDAAMPFYNVITKRKDVFADVANAVDLVHLVDGFSEKEKYEGKKLEAIVFGEKEHVYHMEQLDVFWFLCILQNVLFINGYISKARELGQALIPIVQPYSLTKTVINHEIPIFGLVSSLSQSISLPLVKTKKVLYFLGDSHCLPLAWKTVKIDNEEMLVVPLFIDQLSIGHLSSKKDPVSSLFWHTLSKIPEGSDVVICVGHIDCTERIYSRLSRIEFDSFQEGFVSPSEILVQLCMTLSKEMNIRVFVHPIPPTGFDSPLFARSFNECLMNKFNSIEKGGEKIHFLDIFSQLVNIQEGSNKETVKPEYKFDGFHLNPCYQSLFEEAITKAIKSPAK